MKKIIGLLCLTVLITSCQPEKPLENSMHLKGQIRGLKRGTIYLQQLRDTLVVLDSVQLYGTGNFEFYYPIEQPERLYLYLEKKDDSQFNDLFPFFGEVGELRFSANWDEFDRTGKLWGSKSDSLYREFNSIISDFNIRELELTRLLSENEGPKADSLNRQLLRNQVSRVRYTINFAFIHKESPIAPYAVLNEALEANPSYLDSLYQVLGTEARASVYGKELGEALKQYKQSGKE